MSLLFRLSSPARSRSSNAGFPRSISTFHGDKLSAWIAAAPDFPQHSARFHLDRAHLQNLSYTLPTRGDQQEMQMLLPGWHLSFPTFSHFKESELRDDATDPVFCPPAPYTRRMWAGGKISWGAESLRVGEECEVTSQILDVKKRGDVLNSSVWVTQELVYRGEGGGTAITEERTHVYLTAAARPEGVRKVEGLPKPEFVFSYTPTPTTLFRFSGLTFNGHRIHLDREYAASEGYSERLVHGPLTALMLLEVVSHRLPNLSNDALELNKTFANFEYRAHNPLVVNRKADINVAWEKDLDGSRFARVWATDGDVVIMSGKLRGRSE